MGGLLSPPLCWGIERVQFAVLSHWAVAGKIDIYFISRVVFCIDKPPGQQANNSCQRATVVVVQVDVGVYSIVTIIFIYKLTRCYLQVTILQHTFNFKTEMASQKRTIDQIFTPFSEYPEF